MEQAFNNLTPLAAFPIVLIAIGKALKVSALPNKWIVVILPVIGGIFYCLLSLGDTAAIYHKTGFCAGIEFSTGKFLLGTIPGFVAVWGNQFWRQFFVNGQASDNIIPPVQLVDKPKDSNAK